MIRGLYTSAWSMIANNKKMDVISNNLANANTSAFKKDTVVFESFPELLTHRLNDTRSNLNPSGRIGTMEFSSDVGEVFTYYNQGQMVQTGRSLDLSLEGDTGAFFTVGIPDETGRLIEYYTRDGAFVLNANRQLVTEEGYPVLGENGPITLESEDFKVDAEGIVYQNNAVIDKLLIRSFDDTSTLRKFGSNFVQRTEQTTEKPFEGNVMQGFIEQSNVNIVKEMVDMITVIRSYEANQKLIQSQDTTLEKAVNEVGAVR